MSEPNKETLNGFARTSKLILLFVPSKKKSLNIPSAHLDNVLKKKKSKNDIKVCRESNTFFYLSGK